MCAHAQELAHAGVQKCSLAIFLAGSFYLFGRKLGNHIGGVLMSLPAGQMQQRSSEVAHWQAFFYPCQRLVKVKRRSYFLVQ
eukprot:1161024-Pelagomonas_calceolata.AAC.4